MAALTAARIDYDELGAGYLRTRAPDRRIASLIEHALADATSVVNIGAGTGAYEPQRHAVVAVEPSAALRAARPPSAAPVVAARAESLPFADDAFDAAMGVLTMHHWSDVTLGLAEMRRVARLRVVLFTWDPEFEDTLWLTRDYVPRIREHDRTGYPALARLGVALGPLRIRTVPIPHDCSDGFLGAYWRRPEAYLDAQVRAGISGFARLSEHETEEAVERLRCDLKSGEWERRWGHLRRLEELDLGYRLVVADLS